ncbi:histidine phosphatase family protein [Verrucomicrobia bacterium S94]|nr:histidine phosphatase family protein [Verrucomicrobia bacterium S94]
MPKTLYLVRHAKSSWVNPSYSDFDRPLNDRGRRDALEMARRLKDKGMLPEIIISSPARRAIETLDQLLPELCVDKKQVFMQKRLYEASSETLIEIIQALDHSIRSALVLGHNPSITRAAEKLSGEPVGHLPTSSVAAIKLDSDDWNLAGICAADLLFLDYPKTQT